MQVELLIRTARTYGYVVAVRTFAKRLHPMEPVPNWSWSQLGDSVERIVRNEVAWQFLPEDWAAHGPRLEREALEYAQKGVKQVLTDSFVELWWDKAVKACADSASPDAQHQEVPQGENFSSTN